MAKLRSLKNWPLRKGVQVKIANMEMEYKIGTLEQIQLFLIDILLQLIIEVLDRNPAD